MDLWLLGVDLVLKLAEIVAKRRQLLPFALTCKMFSVGADQYREGFEHMCRTHYIARPLDRWAPHLPENDEPRIPELRDAYMQDLSFAFDCYCFNPGELMYRLGKALQDLSTAGVNETMNRVLARFVLHEMQKMTITREELISTILHAVQWQRGEYNAGPIPQASASGPVVSFMVEQVLDFIVGSDDAFGAERCRVAAHAALVVMDAAAVLLSAAEAVPSRWYIQARAAALAAFNDHAALAADDDSDEEI